MTIAIWVVGTYCFLATAAHIGSILIAARRCRKGRSVSVRSEGKTALGVLGLTRFLRRRGLHYGKQRLGAAVGAAHDVDGVSLVRPVCGLENHIEDTLRSAFDLDYPRYEIIFCAAAANDSALPLVRRLIADHPHVPARLLIGNDAISENPKLNNVCKGWSAAAYDRIVMADSNVLMPRDYIERLLAAWRADTGVVTSPPVGGRPQGFWAELECAFLNTYQVRWQYAAAALGFGFAQGKSMLYRRSQIEAAGGIRLLAAEPAECRHHQTGPCRRSARSPGRCAVRAAARIPVRRRGVGAPAALGAVAAGIVQELLRGGNPVGRSRAAPRPRLGPGRNGLAGGQRRWAGEHLVWG